MADNPANPEGASPSSKPDGKPPISLPPSYSRSKSPSGRVVVTLSSVAKTPPPLNVQPPSGVVAPPKQLPTRTGPVPSSILPAKEATQKQMSSVNRAPQLNRTMEVKLPPKSGVLPKRTTLSSMPLTPPKAANLPAFVVAPQVAPKVNPPPLPAVQPPKPMAEEKNEAKRSPLKLKPLQTEAANPAESIFAEQPPKKDPPGWKHLEPGELPPSADAKTDEVFARVPGLRESEPPKSPGLLPPPLASVKSAAAPVVPPLIAQPLAEPAEKLRLPPATLKTEPVAPVAAVPNPERKLAPPLPSGFVKKAPAVLPDRPALPPPPLPKLASALKKPGAADSLRVEAPPLVLSTPAKEPISFAKLPQTPFIPPTPPVPSAAVVETGKSTPPIKSEVKPAPDVAPPATPVIPVPISSVKKEAAPTPAVPPKSPVEAKQPPASPQPAELPFLAGLFASKTKPVPLVEPKTPAAKTAPSSFSLVPKTIAKSPPPEAPVTASVPDSGAKPPTPRATRARKRRLVGTIAFYVIFLCVIVPALFFLGLHFSSETRIEGQVIPPPGTMLSNEVWIVSDFRELASGIADDLAAERAPKIQEIQERQDHVQRAQADIAAREERIRLLQEQVQAAKDEMAAVIKQAHDAAQKVWDGPGAAMEDDYKSRLAQLQQAIAARAKSLNLKYTPDDTYQSPEVWANAYRLALYQTPPGVDGAKEHQWIEDQLKQWRDFTKSFDDKKEKLRLQAAQIQLSPTARVTDLNAKIDDLQHRVDSTLAEEDPLKAELQQAQVDLAQSQAAEAGLDGKYYQQLYALPESSITKRLPLAQNGRFSWLHLEKDSVFSEGEKAHSYWIFSRAVRKDGRQYWVLAHFSIAQNTLLPILIEPASFVSTKSILRPDLPADEQTQ